MLDSSPGPNAKWLGMEQFAFALTTDFFMQKDSHKSESPQKGSLHPLENTNPTALVLK